MVPFENCWVVGRVVHAVEQSQGSEQMMNGSHWDMGWGMWFVPIVVVLVIYFLVRNASRSKKK